MRYTRYVLKRLRRLLTEEPSLQSAYSDLGKALVVATFQLGLPFAVQARQDNGFLTDKILIEESENGQLNVLYGDYLAILLQFARGELEITEGQLKVFHLWEDVQMAGNSFVKQVTSQEELDIFLEREVGVYQFEREENEKHKKEIMTLLGYDPGFLPSKSFHQQVPVEQSAQHGSIESLIQHPILKKVKIGKGFLSNDKDETLSILAAGLLLSKNGSLDTDLTPKAIYSKFKTKEELIQFLLQHNSELLSVLDFLATAKLDVSELKKTHFPMLYVCGKKMYEKKIEPNQFSQFMQNFFENLPDEYKKASNGGTAHKSNVNTRFKVMNWYCDKIMNE